MLTRARCPADVNGDPEGRNLAKMKVPLLLCSINAVLWVAIVRSVSYTHPFVTREEPGGQAASRWSPRKKLCGRTWIFSHCAVLRD